MRVGPVPDAVGRGSKGLALLYLEERVVKMLNRRSRAVQRGSLAVALGLLMALSLSTSALAHSGDFAKFNYCPSTNPEVFKCLYSLTTGGEIVLGKSKRVTPIVNPVTLQGGYSATNREKKRISSFFGAANGGVTLSKTSEPVPGGLTNIINCKAIENIIERVACELVFENGATGVNATLELAKPASEIQVSEFNMLAEEGLALKLPVMIHLENAFLGGSCYIGSSSSPIIWNLTTGETTTSAPNSSIKGTSGLATLKDEAEIAELGGAELVENDWSAPEASGCGGIFAFAVDPAVDLELGLGAPGGYNTAILKTTIDIATPASVNAH